MVASYVGGDGQVSDGSLSSSDVAKMMPTWVNVDYPSTATLTFTLLPSRPFPFVYLKNREGLVLAMHSFSHAAWPTAETVFTWQVPVPPVRHALTALVACTVACAERDITADVVASMKASAASSSTLPSLFDVSVDGSSTMHAAVAAGNGCATAPWYL